VCRVIINDDTLAAVSASVSLFFMMIRFIQGLAMGAGVVLPKEVLIQSISYFRCYFCVPSSAQLQ